MAIRAEVPYISVAFASIGLCHSLFWAMSVQSSSSGPGKSSKDLKNLLMSSLKCGGVVRITDLTLESKELRTPVGQPRGSQFRGIKMRCLRATRLMAQSRIHPTPNARVERLCCP